MHERRQIWFWLAALAAFVLIVAVLRQVMLPFVAGAVVAYFLNPLADRLEKIGLGRTLATVIILGLAAVAVTTLVFLVAPLAAGQLSQFAQTLPGDLQRAQDSIEKWAAAQL
ncbi:MAG: AI-2E family transporter, partial [Hyphomicrobiaceae bacterium]